MKTGFISDLHVDINEAYPVLDLLAQECRRQQLKLLLIAGDISETPERTIAAMRELRDALREVPSCHVFYVPGNHDMWNKNCPQMDTEEIAALYEGDPFCLAGRKTIRAGGFAAVGDIGWYDYSFADPDFSREQLDGMTWQGRTWQDKYYNSWTLDNPGQMQIRLSRLQAAMDAAGRAFGRNTPLIAVTHMLPIREFTVQDAPKQWSFFNAFLGGEAIGDLLRQYPVRISVSGHVHYRKQLEKDGILWICPCLGYHSEWHLYGLADNEPQTHIRDALQVLDL